MPDSRTFTVARFIADSETFFGEPSYVAAGALYGQTGELTVDEAQALVAAFLLHNPNPPPPTPGSGPAYILMRPRGAWDSATPYLPADAVTGSDGNAYVALAASAGVNPVGDTTGDWLLLVTGGGAPAIAAEVARAEAAEALLIPLAQKAQPGGVATLDPSTGTIPTSQLPALALTDVHPVASQAAMLAIPGAHEGTVAVRSDTNQTFIAGTGDPTQLATWVQLPAIGDIVSVNGHQGVVVLGPADVGADAAGTAASAVARETARAEAAETTNANAITAETTRAEAAEAALAPLASPTLTGTPRAPTAPANTNSTQIATTAYSDAAAAAATAAAEAASDPAGAASAVANAVLAGAPLLASMTANGNLTANSLQPADATAGTIAAALPTATANAGKVILVEKIDATSNLVNVTGKIRGTSGATLPLKLQFESIIFVGEGNGSWRPLAGHKTLTSLDARYLSGAIGNGPRATGGISAPYLRDFISFLDFAGVDSTGATDSTVGINSARLAARAARTYCYAPSGTWKTSPWAVQTGALVANIADIVRGSGMDSTTISFNTTTPGPAVYSLDPTSFNDNAEFHDMAIQGDGVNTTIGFFMPSCRHWRMTKLKFSNFTQYCVYGYGQRSAAGQIVSTTDSGNTSSAPTATTLTDSSKAWTVNQWVGREVTIGGVLGTVTSNTATVLTIGAGWHTLDPPAGSASPAATPASGAYSILTIPGDSTHCHWDQCQFTAMVGGFDAIRLGGTNPIGATLTAGIGATDTTIPITDCAQVLGNAGSGTIDNEQFTFQGKSAASGPGNLTGCIRGINGTTPASHALGAGVSTRAGAGCCNMWFFSHCILGGWLQSTALAVAANPGDTTITVTSAPPENSGQVTMGNTDLVTFTGVTGPSGVAPNQTWQLTGVTGITVTHPINAVVTYSDKCNRHGLWIEFGSNNYGAHVSLVGNGGNGYRVSWYTNLLLGPVCENNGFATTGLSTGIYYDQCYETHDNHHDTVKDGGTNQGGLTYDGTGNNSWTGDSRGYKFSLNTWSFTPDNNTLASYTDGLPRWKDSAGAYHRLLGNDISVAQVISGIAAGSFARAWITQFPSTNNLYVWQASCLNGLGGTQTVYEVDSLSVSNATGGTFTVSFTWNGQTAAFTTGAISATATAAQVQAAIQAVLPSGATVTCTGGPLGTAPVTITFGGTFYGAITGQSTNTTNLTGTGTQTATLTRSTNGDARVLRVLDENTSTNIYLYSGMHTRTPVPLAGPFNNPGHKISVRFENWGASASQAIAGTCVLSYIGTNT